VSTTRTVAGRDPATGEGIAVAIADGHIAAVEPASDAGDLWLSAGLVDLQVNGYAGLDLNGPALEPATVIALGERLARNGITTFAPTLITASEASIVAGLRAIAAARKQSALLREMVPFIHVEGPSISPEDGPRGAHPTAHVRAPSLDEFRRWQAAAEGLIGLVTLSPEWPEAIPYIEALARDGVIVAIGHTAATPEQIHAAAAVGARLSTHLGNGASALLPRHPNFIWAQLADDRLTASFIADGHHLPGDTLKAMLRAKSLDRAILVSDAAALGGMPAGRYTSPIGGEVEVRADGRLGIAGTQYLAGAGHLLTQNVATLVNAVGLSLADALRLATRNPGAFAGGRGTLAVGARVDLIAFRFAPGDGALAVTRSFVAGEEIAR
jgi:N-acetylglucosamine-6-phosphate deacetylase